MQGFATWAYISKLKDLLQQAIELLNDPNKDLKTWNEKKDALIKEVENDN